MARAVRMNYAALKLSLNSKCGQCSIGGAESRGRVLCPEPPRSFPRALRTHVEAEAEAAEELSPVKNRVACNHQIVRVHLTVKPAIKWFRTRY